MAAPFISDRRGALVQGDLTRFFVAMALVVALPGAVIGTSADADRNNVWIVCLLLAAWAGIRLAWLIGDGVPRLFEFSFWLYTYIFMGLAPAAQIHGDNMASTTPGLAASGDSAAIVVVLLGVVAFDVGAIIRRSRPHEEAVVSPSAHRQAAQSATWRSLLLLFASVPVALLLIASVGIAAFFTNRFEFSELSEGRFDPTVLTLLRAIGWVPAMVVVHRIVGRRRLQSDVIMSGVERLAIVIAIALIAINNNPLTSSRYAFGSMALSFIVLFGGCATAARTRRTMLVLILGFLLVFPVADTFRRSERADISISLLDEYSGNPDYDSFGQISNAVDVVGREGLTYVEQPLGVALFWVPRSVWPDKPIDTGVWLAEQQGYNFTNLSSPLWAEAYVAGGHAAVAMAFLGLGYVVVGADRRLVQGLRGERSYSVVGAFMPFYLIILLRGSLLQASALAGCFVAAVWFTRPLIDRGEGAVAQSPPSGHSHMHSDAAAVVRRPGG